MAEAKRIIFYSWQSDLPNKTNRGFIEEALENAVKAIHKDDSIEIKPVIDRDTEGIAGSPDISKTIFSKIIQSDIFLCDVSIVGTIITENGVPRPMPNPNVLVELGYALAKLGDNRIIMVVNDAFGKPELLPFDLRPRKVISYHMPKTHEPATARKVLQDKLTYALTTILKELDALPQEEQPQPLVEQAKIAIENARPNQVLLVREYMFEVANKIHETTPAFLENEKDGWDELLLQAIEQSTELVIEFAKLAALVALVNSSDAAKALYQGFSRIIDLYTLQPPSQRVYAVHPDLARFLGHELFVTFFSFLIKENRWEIIANLLGEDFYARNEIGGSPTIVPFHFISEPIRLLEFRKNRLKLNRFSLHADLLNERHTQGELGKIMPIEDFAEADYFLCLRALIHPTIWWTLLSRQNKCSSEDTKSSCLMTRNLEGQVRFIPL